ncbi:tyrosine-type recombinase/integrase [Mucilaginibacter jinjuensis]|uniref:Phage integrase SAM-like domain-containing protein n=1 Tax=Mucilaginibacter jinjuensis TaxID=1176721 RepID=A0ABY7TAW6_9SPHI|nr:phage integrase SAM-like domain-containing protein [Mucilaginibacter jinjuensis]WCT13481.1 phage integrase SAM-like domain-containing protein [Mucilaginibacter jinjuensis]
MATVDVKILKHHKKADGTYNVKIRVTHKREKKYFDTPHFVTERQLTTKLTIKDPFVRKIVNKLLDDYRLRISHLGEKLDLFTADSLRDYLRDKNQIIDFIKFSKGYIQDLIKDNRNGSAKTMQTVVLSLIDYFQRDALSPMEIDEQMLTRYEKYLRGVREITRLNQFNKPVTRKVKGMSDAGIHNHLRDLRVLFKAAMKFYNKPRIGDNPIPYCPFDNYRIVDAPETRKRNLSVEQIIRIRDFKAVPGSRSELARDLFMLSFYMCGMNAVDLFSLKKGNIVNGRVEYNRAKTKGRRKDRAFISIKLIKPAELLMSKYLGVLKLRYSNFENLDRAVNEGMKIVCKSLKMSPITFYWARHSFASLARNKCRMTKDDVAMALNHIDSSNKVTDIYIEKDWSIVDDVQKAVLTLLTSIAKTNAEEAKMCNQSSATPILNFVVVKSVIANNGNPH